MSFKDALDKASEAKEKHEQEEKAKVVEAKRATLAKVNSLIQAGHEEFELIKRILTEASELMNYTASSLSVESNEKTWVSLLFTWGSLEQKVNTYGWKFLKQVGLEKIYGKNFFPNTHLMVVDSMFSFASGDVYIARTAEEVYKKYQSGDVSYKVHSVHFSHMLEVRIFLGEKCVLQPKRAFQEVASKYHFRGEEFYFFQDDWLANLEFAVADALVNKGFHKRIPIQKDADENILVRLEDL